MKTLLEYIHPFTRSPFWDGHIHLFNSKQSLPEYDFGDIGGDCTNFVSQCILAGGHSALKGGDCRGYPCGKEEVGATRLGKCLKSKFGWTRTCGYKKAPPSNIAVGDVLIYHAGSCDDYTAHAVIIVEAGSSPKIACHSSNKWGASYTYMSGSKPYYEWLHYPK